MSVTLERKPLDNLPEWHLFFVKRTSSSAISPLVSTDREPSKITWKIKIHKSSVCMKPFPSF